MHRSALLSLCVMLSVAGCATPITDIVVSSSITDPRARSRAASRALELCSGVARRRGLEGTVGHYARKLPLGAYGGPTIDIVDRSSPDLISVRVGKPLGSEGGDQLALDLTQSLKRQFGVASVHSRDDTWFAF